jgi:CPA2 family monovalent cation:H+ antiporter-2
MENIELLVDIAFVMVAALVGGFIAHLLKQPTILGYLIGGIIVGPYTPGPVTSVERVQTLANFGVALLMFALGVEFSLEALQRVRNVAVYGGAIQLVLAIGLGTSVGLLLGYSLTSSIFLGGVISISSSILMLKLLLSRGEVESIVGRVSLGTSIVQDISTIALIVILPALSGEVGLELLGSAAIAVLQGGVFLAVAYLVGTRVLPPLLARLARLGSRELFLLTIVGIAVGMAVLGHVAGISFALGAFIGGLVVSESEFSSEVLDEIIPTRDIFATLFFVSIGMLLNPGFLITHIPEILLLVGAIIIGKFVIASIVVRLFGYEAQDALRTGLLLAQIGEFSFVLAGVGFVRGAITDDLYELILAAALVTLILNPVLVNNVERFSGPLLRFSAFVNRLLPRRLGGRGLFAPRMSAVVQTDDEKLSQLRRHVVICGYGRVGQEVSRALSLRGFPFVVIDYSPTRIEECHRQGFLCIQGDATDAKTLERAGASRANMVAVSIPDPVSAEQIILAVRRMAPKIDIVARTHDARAIPYLKGAGASNVIQPEFEAGLEMMRQALRKYGVSSLEAQAMLGTRRQEHYRAAPVRDYYKGEIERDYSDDPFWR